MDPMQQVAFGVESLPGGDRLLKTVGASILGGAEICARVAASRDHAWDHRVMDVLRFIVGYVRDSGRPIRAGESMSYGWQVLRFVERAPGLLEAYELEDPLGADANGDVTHGVDRGIHLVAAGNDVMRRNRLTGQSD